MVFKRKLAITYCVASLKYIFPTIGLQSAFKNGKTPINSSGLCLSDVSKIKIISFTNILMMIDFGAIPNKIAFEPL